MSLLRIWIQNSKVSLPTRFVPRGTGVPPMGHLLRHIKGGFSSCSTPRAGIPLLFSPRTNAALFVIGAPEPRVRVCRAIHAGIFIELPCRAAPHSPAWFLPPDFFLNHPYF